MVVKRGKVGQMIRQLVSEGLQTCDMFPVIALWNTYLRKTNPTERVSYEEFLDLAKFNFSGQCEFVEKYKDNDSDYFFYVTGVPHIKLDTVNGFEAFVRRDKYSYGKGEKIPTSRYYEAKYSHKSDFSKEKRRFVLYCIGHDENYKKKIKRDGFNKLTDTKINDLSLCFVFNDKK